MTAREEAAMPSIEELAKELSRTAHNQVINGPSVEVADWQMYWDSVYSKSVRAQYREQVRTILNMLDLVVAKQDGSVAAKVKPAAPAAAANRSNRYAVVFGRSTVRHAGWKRLHWNASERRNKLETAKSAACGTNLDITPDIVAEGWDTVTCKRCLKTWKVERPATRAAAGLGERQQP